MNFPRDFIAIAQERDRLRQENAQLREALLRLSVSTQRLSEEAALALARGSLPTSEKQL